MFSSKRYACLIGIERGERYMRENRLAKRVGRTRGRLAPELLLLSVAYGLGLTAGHFIGRAAGADAEIRTYLAAYAQALESGSTVTAAQHLALPIEVRRITAPSFKIIVLSVFLEDLSIDDPSCSCVFRPLCFFFSFSFPPAVWQRPPPRPIYRL